MISTGAATVACGPDEVRSTTVSITAVVVTHDSAAVIEGCLRSLAVALGPSGTHRVVVVDNASSDASATLAQQALPWATVVRSPANDGYAAGINSGVAWAGPDDAILVLNPDVRLEPGAVDALLAALDDGVGIVVPRLLDADGDLAPSLRCAPSTARAGAEAVLGGRLAGRLGWGEMITSPARYAAPHDVAWASGAAFLIHRPCLDDIGGLDESFFLYSEETDFMLRAGDAGWAVRYVPGATGVHLGGEMSTSPALWALRCVNAVRLHRRRHHRTSSAAFLLATLANEVTRAAVRPTSRRAVARLAREGPGIVIGPAPPPDPDGPGWICFSAQDWWYMNRAHSDFQLLQRLARRRPVLLVNSIGLRVPMPGRSTGSARRVARKAASVARLVRRPDPRNPGFHVMSPLSLPRYGTPRQRALNAWLVRAQVDLAARVLGITGADRPDPVVMVTIPTAIDTIEGMATSAVVTYRSDKHSGFPEADGRVIEQLEVRCLERADLVFYSAGALLDTERGHTGDRARILDHGVDASHFRRRPDAEVPRDLRAIPHPRVGFFGGLDDYLVDFDLLEQLATSLPDVHLVLIGDATCSMRRFDRYGNVHHLGYRPYSSMPAYGSGFDVALMPWLDNEWIRHSNPIKLKEYLALGLPVVSTDFPEVHRYDHLVRIAATPSEFVDAVARTVRDGGPSDPRRRREAVAPITWEAAAQRLLVETESLVAAPPTAATRLRRPTPAPAAARASAASPSEPSRSAS